MEPLQKQAGNVANFRNVDQADEPAYFVPFLDAINRLESVQALKRSIAAQLQAQEGQSILDVGCGIGDAAQTLAALVGSAGRVVGVDSSEYLIQEARRRAEGTGLSVDYRVGDAHQLDFTDQSFDGCRADRVFMFLEDPRRALTEMIRVTRPGGRIVIYDIDWDGMMADHPDRALTRKVFHLGCESVRHGWMGRQLPALFRENALGDVTVSPHMIVPDYAFFTRVFRGLLNRASETGVISTSELSQWWDPLEQADQQGLFFAAVPGFIISGRKL
ncbi:MAG TPA: methyltransferase domain-containing protein [Ktedonobacterales bacterium]|nr:methyltransferase domain-containing protein [Ktedonobacterales bacterium]